jgi:hypothetical protein
MICSILFLFFQSQKIYIASCNTTQKNPNFHHKCKPCPKLPILSKQILKCDELSMQNVHIREFSGSQDGWCERSLSRCIHVGGMRCIHIISGYSINTTVCGHTTHATNGGCERWAAGNRTHDSRAGVLYYRTSSGSFHTPNCLPFEYKILRRGKMPRFGQGLSPRSRSQGRTTTGPPPSLSSSSLQLVVAMNMIQAKRRPEIRGGLRIAIDRRCRWFFGWTGENKWQSRYFATEKLNTWKLYKRPPFHSDVEPAAYRIKGMYTPFCHDLWPGFHRHARIYGLRASGYASQIKQTRTRHVKGRPLAPALISVSFALASPTPIDLYKPS